MEVLIILGLFLAGGAWVIYDEISKEMKIKALTQENEQLKREVAFYSRTGVSVNSPDQRQG